MTDIDDERHCVGIWLAYPEGQLAHKLKANIDKYMGLHDVRSIGGLNQPSAKLARATVAGATSLAEQAYIERDIRSVGWRSDVTCPHCCEPAFANAGGHGSTRWDMGWVMSICRSLRFRTIAQLPFCAQHLACKKSRSKVSPTRSG